MFNDISIYNTVLCVVVWIFCGLIAYGGAYGECSEKHSGNSDTECFWIRWFMFLMGPAGLFAVAMATRLFQNGLRFK